MGLQVSTSNTIETRDSLSGRVEKATTGAEVMSYYDNFKAELFHHLLPSSLGGVAVIATGHAIFVGVSVTVISWLVTHGLSAVFSERKNIFSKIAGIFRSTKL
jgi:hypothetical protein